MRFLLHDPRVQTRHPFIRLRCLPIALTCEPHIGWQAALGDYEGLPPQLSESRSISGAVEVCIMAQLRVGGGYSQGEAGRGREGRVRGGYRVH